MKLVELRALKPEEYVYAKNILHPGSHMTKVKILLVKSRSAIVEHQDGRRGEKGFQSIELIR